MDDGRKIHFGLVFVLLLVTTAVYVNSLRNPFVVDDRAIIFQNAPSSDNWTFAGILRHSLIGANPSSSGYFRPLTSLTFVLNFSLARDRPAGYRIVNIALHLLVVAAVFVFFSLLSCRWIAALSALLFSVHPAHVQAVSYISSRSELLYTALGLLCLICWHQGCQSRGWRRAVWLGGALFAFFTGLFAKETMVIVPLLAVVMDLSWSRSTWRRTLKENFGWYLGFVLLFCIYLSIRVGEGFPLTQEAGRQLDFFSRLRLAFKLFALNLGVVFYPLHLSLFRVVPLPGSIFEWHVILGLVLLVALLALVYLFWRLRREVSFGILWFLISILPVLNLTLLVAPMMEHWLYLPLIGLTMAVVGMARGLAEMTGRVRDFAVGICFIALLLSIRTVIRNHEWYDLVSVYSRDVELYPGNPRAWRWLGESLQRRGRFDEAARAYRNSLAINPNRSGTWEGLGYALLLAGKRDEALKAFSQALSMNPEDQLLLSIVRQLSKDLSGK